jgi:hypothetical protein
VELCEAIKESVVNLVSQCYQAKMWETFLLYQFSCITSIHEENYLLGCYAMQPDNTDDGGSKFLCKFLPDNMASKLTNSILYSFQQ